MISVEQRARDILERMGVEGAQNFTAGDLVELANALSSQPASEAISIAVRFGGIDGGHHKAWVIDQMVRALAGEQYEMIVKDAKAGEDGPDTYTWDEGVAP